MPACMTELLTAHARGDPAYSLAGRGSGAGLQGVIGRDGEAGPMGFLPGLGGPAVRAVHGGAHGGCEHVATLAGVAGQVGRAAGLAHALSGGVGRKGGEVRWRWGEIGLRRVGGGVFAANTLDLAPHADRM
jgi:hypothetical protein